MNVCLPIFGVGWTSSDVRWLCIKHMKTSATLLVTGDLQDRMEDLVGFDAQELK